MTVADPKFWTPEQMAQELQITPEYLSKLRSRGGGPPYVKVGRTVRYPQYAVAKWIQETAVTDRRKGLQVY